MKMKRGQRGEARYDGSVWRLVAGSLMDANGPAIDASFSETRLIWRMTGKKRGSRMWILATLTWLKRVTVKAKGKSCHGC